MSKVHVGAKAENGDGGLPRKPGRTPTQWVGHSTSQTQYAPKANQVAAQVVLEVDSVEEVSHAEPHRASPLRFRARRLWMQQRAQGQAPSCIATVRQNMESERRPTAPKCWRKQPQAHAVMSIEKPNDRRKDVILAVKDVNGVLLRHATVHDLRREGRGPSKSEDPQSTTAALSQNGHGPCAFIFIHGVSPDCRHTHVSQRKESKQPNIPTPARRNF